MQGAWSQPLVGELRSCMLHSMAINKKEIKKKKIGLAVPIFG